MASFAPPDRRIPWWAGPSAFGILIILLILFSGLLRIIMSVVKPDAVLRWAASPVGLAVQVAVMSSVFAGFALAVPKLWRVSPAKWLCLNRVKLSIYTFAVLGVLGLGFLVDELVFLLYHLNPEFFDPSGLDMFNQLFTAASPGVFALLTAVVTLGPGIGEELFFRGLIMRSLLSSTPAAAAVGVSAVLFGLIHFDVLQSPGAALIGLYLGFIALRANSLFPAMVAHGTNNLLCALFARFTDNNAPGPLAEGHPVLLLAAAALLLIVALVLFFRVTRRPTADLSQGPPVVCL